MTGGGSSTPRAVLKELAQPGVGPVTAAQLLISWSHPGRLRSYRLLERQAAPSPA